MLAVPAGGVLRLWLVALAPWRPASLWAPTASSSARAAQGCASSPRWRASRRSSRSAPTAAPAGRAAHALLVSGATVVSLERGVRVAPQHEH
jgi:hypothetical protein